MKKEEKNDKKNEELLKQIEELTHDLQRTRADFENYRKQIEMQIENSKKTATLSTVYKFLSMVDDLERAISAYPELKPLEATFRKTLASLSLEKIDSDEGTEFNPDLHDAIAVEGDGEKEVVAETLRSGYLYEKNVLRPAMVKVKRD